MWILSILDSTQFLIIKQRNVFHQIYIFLDACFYSLNFVSCTY
uniref:Uncharacterized protein n=1 Tax=Anguilla anguilla TaxID=7936 RepID=A0A0E9R5D5_ANGAN